jgi:hypothetical protein
MATPLPPPPLNSPSSDPAWGRWFSLLQSILKGYSVPSGIQVVGSASGPAFLNSWSNYSTGWQSAAFYCDAPGWVTLLGQVKGGASGTSAFQLPTGFRPASNIQFPCMFNNAFGYVSVDSQFGYVNVTGSGTATFATLNGIRFPAAS